MRALMVAGLALLLTACQGNPTVSGGAGSGSNTAKKVDGAYPAGVKRYEVSADLKKPKMTMAQAAAEKEAAATARNIERNKQLAEDSAQAALHYTQENGIFNWKHSGGAFNGEALGSREDLNIPGGGGYKLEVAGKFDRWDINARLRSIDFGVLTDKSSMIVAHLNKGGDYKDLQPSLRVWDKALSTCRSTLPYVFGDLYLVMRTTNPKVAAMQVCLYEESKTDPFLAAFMTGGEALDEFVGNNGLDISLN